ncbi:hypothetical protein F4825DRAFT_430226 [Nemania diffusa]|nr:hypothetical protein F4825DRAFT_430226 [Nemania diffusa]
MEYEKSQVSIASLKGSQDSPQWGNEYGVVHKSDVTQAAELIIYIYLDVSNTCPQGQDVFVGLARLSPLDGATMSGPQWLELQHGSGRICIDLSYKHLEDNTPQSNKIWGKRLSRASPIV